METDVLLKRITIDPEICHGKPCLRGLRYPVEVIWELLSAGMTNEDILTDYEDLEREDILASRAFATPESHPYVELDRLHLTIHR